MLVTNCTAVTGGRKLVQIKELHLSMGNAVCSISLNHWQQAKDRIGVSCSGRLRPLSMFCMFLFVVFMFLFLQCKFSVSQFSCAEWMLAIRWFECDFVFLSQLLSPPKCTAIHQGRKLSVLWAKGLGTDLALPKSKWVFLLTPRLDCVSV